VTLGLFATDEAEPRTEPKHKAEMNNKIKTNRHNDTTENHRSHAEITIEEQNRPTPKKSTSRITQPPLQVKKGGIRVEAVAKKAKRKETALPNNHTTQHNLN